MSIGLILLSYLSGAIPSGYLIVRRMRGFDIRERGSGNPGAANVYRMAGTVPGLLTLAIDALKGYLPVWLALRHYPGLLVPMLCGAAAVVGHDWTIFLGFRGGKGVATSAGVFAALTPKALALAAAVFALSFAASGHISVGSMTAAAALPFLALASGAPGAFSALAAGSGLLILYKHIPNIQRLTQRKELHL
jgi:acyl phosphate:glycerol-3-phosphate acyltransferase